MRDVPRVDLTLLGGSRPRWTVATPSCRPRAAAGRPAGPARPHEPEPGGGDPVARRQRGPGAACLRTGLWRANRVVPSLIRCAAATVDLGEGVDVDARRLIASALAVLRSDGPADGAALGALGDGGDLLPDWDDDWLADDRERVRQLRMHRLEGVAERLSAQGRFGLAVAAALAAVRAGAYRESAHPPSSRPISPGNVVEAPPRLRGLPHGAHLRPRRGALAGHHPAGVPPSRRGGGAGRPRRRRIGARRAAARCPRRAGRGGRRRSPRPPAG